MKTKEQIKQEIVNYLTKTSIHTFIKPKATFKWKQEGSHYEYDYNEFTYFKVIKIGEDFYFLDKKMKSVKSNKYHLEEISKILDIIK